MKYGGSEIKLTGKLKENVEKSGSGEEAKKLIVEAGFDLTDEEIEKVTGGIQAGRIDKRTRGEFEKVTIPSDEKGAPKRVRDTYL
ncbi:MAG: hypothetical protein J5835_07655 [Bacteroidales bacterium]|nr:hypothetical protein [Bacteroidales bacterium]